MSIRETHLHDDRSHVQNLGEAPLLLKSVTLSLHGQLLEVPQKLKQRGLVPRSLHEVICGHPKPHAFAFSSAS